MVRIARLSWKKGLLGIEIWMYTFPREHNPPHFHVEDGENEAEISILNGELVSGEIDPKTHKIVLDWFLKHRQELMDNWILCEQQERPKALDGQVD